VKNAVVVYTDQSKLTKPSGDNFNTLFTSTKDNRKAHTRKRDGRES
jgi:hypothetical protein